MKKNELLTPDNCRILFIDHQPRFAHGARLDPLPAGSQIARAGQ